MVLFGLVRAGLNHMSRPRQQMGAMPIPSSRSSDRVRQSRGIGRSEAPDLTVTWPVVDQREKFAGRSHPTFVAAS